MTSDETKEILEQVGANRMVAVTVGASIVLALRLAAGDVEAWAESFAKAPYQDMSPTIREAIGGALTEFSALLQTMDTIPAASGKMKQ
jgi:hypothetical protein